MNILITGGAGGGDRGAGALVRVLHDIELNRPLYYFTVPGMTGPGRRSNIVNAKYPGYNHGS